MKSRVSFLNVIDHKFFFWKWEMWVIFGLLLSALSLSLAWISSGFKWIEPTTLFAWVSFFVILLIGSFVLMIAWWSLKQENPPLWLGFLLLGAILLRLSAGALWFSTLPIWGHGTTAEKGGYVMADAGARDQLAWKIARSDKPLWSAFLNNRKVDQYGGFLFMSALVYRYLSMNLHLPLLIVLITSIFSSLAILFTWAFSYLAWGEKEAIVAAWVLMLYPEAILLGSSQMREAFTVTLTMITFYGLLRYQCDHSWQNLGWILFPLLLCLPFSPPIAALLLGMLILLSATSRISIRIILHRKAFWIVIVVLIFLVIIGLYFTLRQFTPEEIHNPLAMLSWWFRKSGQFQAYISQHASGWLQKVFKTSPEWTHLPLLLGYGVVQPFLPAAIIVGSHSPIWRLISLWRSFGWAIMLVLLIYASFLAFRKKNQGFTKMLCLIMWIVILIASFRGGGDMWDNPRYRATAAGLQAALVGWALVEHQRVKDPWLRRAIIAAVAIFAWFLPWYLRRYTAFYWPVVDLYKTLGLGIVTTFLLCLWDWTVTSYMHTGDRENQS